MRETKEETRGRGRDNARWWVIMYTPGELDSDELVLLSYSLLTVVLLFRQDVVQRTTRHCQLGSNEREESCAGVMF